MKKLFIFFVLMIQVSSSFASISRPCGAAIEWWLRGQGKFDGAHISTQQNKDGSFTITRWEANGVSQPSDSEIEKIIDNYNAQYQPPKSLENRMVDLESKVETQGADIKAIQSVTQVSSSPSPSTPT